MRLSSSALLLVLLLGGCSIYPKGSTPPQEDHALVRIVIKDDLPDVKAVAKQEARAEQQVPACLGTFAAIIVGQILSVPPPPLDKVAIPFDLAATWLGDRCLKE